jgi:hypothetical protein
MLRGSKIKNKKTLLPGIFSNFCGPGGYASMLPQNRVDEICQQHDRNYDEILKQGKNPYFSYNWADKIMQDQLRVITPSSIREKLVSDVATSLWNAKKQYLTNDLSLLNLPDTHITPAITNQKRELNITPTSNKKRKLFEDTPTMNQIEDDIVMAAASASSDTKSKGNQETPITNVPPTFGLPETHTAILPLTTYFSVAQMDHGDCSATTLKVRMTTPYDPIPTTPLSGTLPYSPTKGIYVHPLTYGNNPTYVAGSFFPKTWTGGEIPAWRDYYGNIYDVYTVLGCHWRATIRSAGSANGADITVATAFESYGASSTGNEIPANATLDETYAWKGFKYSNLANYDNDQADRKDVIVISGSYKPGQSRTNVKNDEDVKTWTAIGSLPSLTEQLKIFFWRSPLANSNTSHYGCNVMLEVKYIVQFKDLKTQGRYPKSGTTTINQSLPTDILQVA